MIVRKSPNGKLAHYSEWTNEVKKEQGNHGYKYYLKGRVYYQPETNMFYVIEDKCLAKDLRYENEIEEAFQIDEHCGCVLRTEEFSGEPITKLAKRGHYVCHMCGGVE